MWLRRILHGLIWFSSSFSTFDFAVHWAAFLFDSVRDAHYMTIHGPLNTILQRTCMEWDVPDRLHHTYIHYILHRDSDNTICIYFMIGVRCSLDCQCDILSALVSCI